MEGVNTRKLTIVAKDPGFRLGEGKGSLAFVQVDVPAELLASGPTGYRVKVVDYNPAERVVYENRQRYEDHQGNLIDPFRPLDGEDATSEAYEKRLIGNPNFHSQNAYAIVMRTLARFERALGRRVSWSFGGHQLHIAPHAFDDANAFYSEADRALMFGYFYQKDRPPVFTCLSHDIIAHETSHAILDGLRSRYTAPSSPDQAAFHEGFADIVALLSVFSLEDVVAAALGEERTPDSQASNIRLIAKRKVTPDAIKKSILLGIAKQVGAAVNGGRDQALRQSVQLAPDTKRLQAAEWEQEHKRGEILVASIMHAFVEIWHARIKALGTFKGGKYNLDLVVEKGAQLADQLLTMCIRALDYCPPTDLDFGQYLAGLLTADFELVPDDSRFRYRATILESFKAYGISLPSEGCDQTTGIWRGFAEAEELTYSRSNYDAMTHDRDEFFRFLWDNRRILGISDRGYIEVVSVDRSIRLGPDGIWLRETICQYVETAHIFGAETEAVLGAKRPEGVSSKDHIEAFGGGVIVLDQYGRVKYHIANPLRGGKRQADRIAYLSNQGLLRKQADGRSRFASLHLKRMEG